MMAERTGLEPATPGVTGRYSNQLNYRSGWGGALYRARPALTIREALPQPGAGPILNGRSME